MKEINLNDKSFHEFIDYQIKYRYQCKDYRTIANSSQLLLAGPDLYRFFQAYKTDNIKKLPTSPRFIKTRSINGCRYKLNSDRTELYRCLEIFDLSPQLILENHFVFNCFHIAYNLDFKEIVKSSEYDTFLESGEIEVSSFANSKLINEELEIIENMNLQYFNKTRESAFFKLLQHHNYQRKQDDKIYKFLLRLQINQNKRLSNKIRNLSQFPSTLRWLIENSQFSMSKFADETKQDIPQYILEKFEYLITYHANIIQRMTIESKLHNFIIQVTNLYYYIKNYPNFIIYLIEKGYFKQSVINPDMIKELLNDKVLVKNIFDELDNVVEPLPINKFKQRYHQFQISELLNFNTLKKEGFELSHCLGSLPYFEKLQSNCSRYYSLLSTDSRSTVQISKYESQINIAEHKSYKNEKPSIEHQILARKLVRFLNKYNLWK